MLSRGDRVRLVSPSTPPSRVGAARIARVLRGWGLRVEFGAHALAHGVSDDERLADVNDALGDPGVRAVIATRGGKGAVRIADRLDVAAARRDPKPLVGFSETTVLHLALARGCGAVGLHGGLASWNARPTPEAVESLRAALFSDEPIRLRPDPDESTAALTTGGTATGFLMGGNLDLVAAAAGWALPDLDGAILLLEDIGLGPGGVDRRLGMLVRGGFLRGVRGVAVGQFSRARDEGDPAVIAPLRGWLERLGVPVLGGLPIGHGRGNRTVRLGTEATLGDELVVS